MNQPMPTSSQMGVDVLATAADRFKALRDPVLMELLQGRIAEGVSHYGTRLMTHNGRDSLQDEREELLDAMLYALQSCLEAEDRGDMRASSMAYNRFLMVKATLDDLLRSMGGAR